MKEFVRSLWNNQEGQDVAEYAVMLAVILVIVVGTIRLVGSNANNGILPSGLGKVNHCFFGGGPRSYPAHATCSDNPVGIPT